ncbi:MAG: SMC-Scp complex subunit ScpB [Candidatus Aminicenantaceae bacterium]
MTSELMNIIESLIFVAQEPVSPEKLKSILSDFEGAEVESALAELECSYAENNRGIQIQNAAGGYLFITRPEFDPWIKKMLHLDKKTRLSPAALETLSIIAYHQPLTLSEISAMRGVDSAHSLKTLLLKRLVKITGRKKSPGKPLIYRTSNKFLSYFGLNSLKDLPTPDEIEKILVEEQTNE